ncbi:MULTISPECIES: cisplatin damage response ATP-dependent DNA ligase [Rhodomicrobium]|uniref:cisplatin damage response ATP-dependent DNA ligase n=1 Tax=Rhodomicrobium TaxID=1068 RepID=UPI000B4B8A46|nr:MULTISPECIES: cisplatin damage response ATP-dependent DNA ligase [Rhodomicrobium]
MRAFADLLDHLYFSHSNLAKAALLHDYFRRTPDPDRGWAVAAIAGELRFDLFKRAIVRDLIVERADPVLFAMSYDYVGEMSETVAHLWPAPPAGAEPRELPLLHEIIAEFGRLSKAEIRVYLASLLDIATPAQRWALLKLGTQGLRVGISARFMKRTLADYGGVPLADVEEVWHGLTPPYADLFDWLEGRAPKPDTSEQVVFHPVMLSNAIDDADIGLITPEEFQAEWKYDGIRVQLVSLPAGKGLFSRTGDDVSAAFPDLLDGIDFHAVLDGELVIRKDGEVASFNDLQQRLNRKTPSAKLIADAPAHLVLYDALRIEDLDLRALPLTERRAHLDRWYIETQPRAMDLAQPLPFDGPEALTALRAAAPELGGVFVEGLMLKRKSGPYVAARPQGQWYKWKRDPKLVDAVLMYAQRGSGKRSSFYSDYTFGLWRNEELLPVGKAYFGFTDEELRLLDRWVRNNTVNRFGPVREVEKALVFEVAFDSVHASTRHKSGVAMRFPRINRIRWDKPADEADRLETLEKLIG